MSKHGCHNRPPFRDWHHAQDGYHANTTSRVQRLVQIPHVMTRDCQYTKQEPGDQRCAGCCHQQKDQK